MTPEVMITAAYRKIGFAAGETPSASEMADGLFALRKLLDSWSAQALPIPNIAVRTLALTGSASYVPSPRPIKVKAVNATSGGMVIPMALVTAEEWASGAGSQAHPAIFFDGGYPTATMYVRPAVTGTLEYYAYEPLNNLLELETPMDLPYGYDRALVWNLAVEMAPEFSFPMENPQAYAELVKMATESKLSIVGENAANLGQPVPVGPQAQQNQ